MSFIAQLAGMLLCVIPTSLGPPCTITVLFSPRSPKYLVAPMVEQSELAFRLLTKRYGAQLTYSPMVHSRILVERGATSHQWLMELLTAPGDRPMIVQVMRAAFFRVPS